MKRILAAALACAVLLAGCAVPAPTSEAPASTPAASLPEPTPDPAPAPKEVSLEEWQTFMPADAPSFLFNSTELALDEDVLWPEQLELFIPYWEGTPEDADAAFGLPAGSFSVWEDSYYSPVEGTIAIHAEGYVPPQTPVQQVTVKVPWVEFTFNRSAAYTVPAALDRQAAGALAAAQYFLSHHHGTHHGLEPCTYDEATWSYTATEGAMYVRYSELEQFLGCVFTPEASGENAGRPPCRRRPPRALPVLSGRGRHHPLYDERCRRGYFPLRHVVHRAHPSAGRQPVVLAAVAPSRRRR